MIHPSRVDKLLASHVSQVGERVAKQLTITAVVDAHDGWYVSYADSGHIKLLFPYVFTDDQST